VLIGTDSEARLAAGIAALRRVAGDRSEVAAGVDVQAETELPVGVTNVQLIIGRR